MITSLRLHNFKNFADKTFLIDWVRELTPMVSDKTFENTSVTCCLEDSNDAIIRAVADLPNAEELRKNQGLGRLLAGGWMETALAFTEGRDDDRVA